jgi:hypothetical protein
VRKTLDKWWRIAVVSEENLGDGGLDAAEEKTYDVESSVSRTTAACILKNLQSWDYGKWTNYYLNLTMNKRLLN